MDDGLPEPSDLDAANRSDAIAPSPPRFMYPDDRTSRRRRRRSTILAVAIVVVLVVGFTLTRCGSSPESDVDRAVKLFNRGLSEYDDGNYAAARADFRSASLRDPQNPAAFFYLGVLSQAVDHNPAGAQASYESALEADPKYDRALFNLAILRANAGDNDEAVALYRRVVALKPKNAKAHFNLGLVLRDIDPTSPEAATELAKAVELDPSLQARVPATTTTTTSTTTKKR